MAEQTCFTSTILREGEDKILRVDCESCPFPPSIEDSPICMSKTVDLLLRNAGVTKIILVLKRDYEYDYNQTQLLVELAAFYRSLSEDKRLSYGTVVVGSGGAAALRQPYASLQYIIQSTLKSDPIGAYLELRRLSRKLRIQIETTVDTQAEEYLNYFISLTDWVADSLEHTKLLSQAQPYLSSYKKGDREIYRRLFQPIIKPDFMFAKLMATYPPEGKVLANYTVGDSEVTIFGFPDTARTLYHVIPPEFRFDEAEYELLDTARKIMSEHKPTKEEFVNPERMREVFTNVGVDLLKELINERGLKMTNEQITTLAQVLLRYTVGFGLIEVLLLDPRIQDISINSPMGQTPIFIVHQNFDDCYTNIIPTEAEAQSWATKLRLVSGRPLDEANPILDTELVIPGMTSRVAAVNAPLDPSGLAFSFRRHRDKPWTLPLFIHNKMLNPIAAGLLSFMVDGNRTFLVAGRRSCGKTSLLGSMLVVVMRRYRIITVEDTLELPVTQLIKLGYNMQSLKVASALAGKESSEVEASIGIRSTLRLGDSALIIGEIRSQEAIALYEAMRVGAAANIVAGTIHGADPYSVFDRVVNDIGVPRTSFKATDIIVVANPIRTASGLSRQRRVLSITEVRKQWKEDPGREGGFVDLLKYDPTTDQLEVTDALQNGDSDILKDIAGNIKDFSGNWDAVWDNIQLRAAIKNSIVETAHKTNDLDLLEADFVTQTNDMFHIISARVKEEVGNLDSKRILFEFNEWLRRAAKKRQ